MQSFRVDFEMNQGHEMTIDRESGILRSELDEIELRMLSERIPYLLPVDWLELDGKVTFRYKLSGMKMLLHRLQQHPLTMKQYYSLILGVTDALFECKHYMLRPEGCLLNEQYIFTSEKLHDIRLVYVPMKGGTGEQTIGGGNLLSLIVRFTAYIDQIDGEGLKRMLQHLTGKRWPLAELRATLLELIDEPPLKQRSGAVQTLQKQQAQQLLKAEQYSQPVQQQRTEQQSELVIQPSPKQQHEPLQPYSNKKDEPNHHTAPSKINFADTLSIEETEPETKRKWVLTAGLATALACVWRFVYFTAATRQSLLISVGISLLLLAAVLFVWRKRVNQNAAPVETEFELSQYEPGSGMFPGFGNIYEELDMSEAVSQKSSHGLYEAFSAVHSEVPLQELPAHLVSPVAEPTVLLERGQQQLSGDPSIWLQRSWEGHDSKLELSEGCFKIGRMGEQINYVDAAGGVSRLHLEIESAEGVYKAKDLGSRNGSLLNGQTMIPYKSYKFSIGDVIHLAGANGPSYELKMGLSAAN